MTVPYSFASRTTAIPLSELDSNFNTAITLGNTAIQLGNTVTTLNNMTLANVTISSGNVTITNVSVTTANVTTLNVATAIVTSGETLSYGTANGVAYLDGSKVLTTGSAITFDGTNFATTGTASATKLIPTGGTATGNGMYLPASNTLAWSNNGSETMRLDSSGNLGLGVTPSASTIPQFEGGSNLLLVSRGNAYISNNATYNGGWKYISTATAAQYNISNNAHYWLTAPSGTAGNAISFTQAMTLDASGNLGIGTSSPSARLHAETSGSACNFYVKSDISTSALASRVCLGNSNGAARFTLGLFGSAAEAAYFGSESSFPLYFQTNGTERMRIDSSGNVGIGTSSLGVRLNVSGNSDTTFTNSPFNVSLISTNAQAANVGPGILFQGVYTNSGLVASLAAISGVKENSTDADYGGALTFMTRLNGSGGGNQERMRLNSTGALVLQSGNPLASGTGITFPATQSASSDANTLDDYEEGTWTPVFVAATGTLGSITYENRGGTYTKIGNTVFVTCTFYTSAFAAGSGSGNLFVGGLPFTSQNAINSVGGLAISDSRLWTTNNPSGIRTNTNATTCILYYRTTANGQINNIQVSDAGTVNPSNVVTFGGCYTVA